MQMEENIADFAAELGCAEVEAQYRELAAERCARHAEGDPLSGTAHRPMGAGRSTLHRKSHPAHSPPQ